ncbi:MAG TPA: DUF3024 domain-containing protein [Nocardioidaceae bacterium]|nr:DUF3024 domain-containing protein [Nocardioidaceae bacterium]
MGPLPETDLARVRRYCQGRVPERVRDQVDIDYTTRGHSVTIVQRRPPGGTATTSAATGSAWTTQRIAQLRYDESSPGWTLYWSDRNERWHAYDMVQPNQPVQVLLDEIEADPTSIFWG